MADHGRKRPRSGTVDEPAGARVVDRRRDPGGRFHHGRGQRGRGGRGGRGRGRHPWRGPSRLANPDSVTESTAIATPRCDVCHEAEHPKYKCPRCDHGVAYCSIACFRLHKEQFHNESADASSASRNVDNEAIALPATPDDQKPAAAETSAPSRYLRPDDVQRFQAMIAEALASDPMHGASNEDDDLEWRITNDMKQEMQSSTWLQKELQDVGLQQLIRHIVLCSNNVVAGAPRNHAGARQHHGNAGRANKMRDPPCPETEQERTLCQLQQQYPLFQRFVDQLLLRVGVLELSPTQQPLILADTSSSPVVPPSDAASSLNVLDEVLLGNEKGQYPPIDYSALSLRALPGGRSGHLQTIPPPLLRPRPHSNERPVGAEEDHEGDAGNTDSSAESSDDTSSSSGGTTSENEESSAPEELEDGQVD
jgi:HIT zinc finger